VTTLAISVGSGADDVGRRLTGDYYGNTDQNIFAGRYSSSYKQYGSGVRFTGITINHGDSIVSAVLTGTGANLVGTGTAYSYLSALDADDAPTWPATAAEFDALFSAHTTARVSWVIPSWPTAITRTSPEIASVIQEVIDRPGWESGNALSLFWEDFDDRTSTDNLRVIASFDSSSFDPPELTVEYTEGGGIVHPVIGSGIINSRAIIRGAA